MVAAGPAFAPTLALMHRLAFPEDPWDAQSFSTLLAQPGVCGLIDERGGFLLLRQVVDEAEILTIGVTQLRQNIGSGLVLAALDQLRAQNVKKLHLEVAATNEAARALYAKFGFVQVGTRKAYYPGGGDALVFALEV